MLFRSNHFEYAKDDAWFYPGRDGSATPFGKFKVIDVAFSPNADIAVVTDRKSVV